LDKVQITTKCPSCGEKKIMYVSAKGFKSWKEGGHIQDAFPTLSPDDRERLLSGLCPACWDKEFGGEW
jgi:hypothetical protein